MMRLHPGAGWKSCSINIIMQYHGKHTHDISESTVTAGPWGRFPAYNPQESNRVMLIQAKSFQ